MPKERAPFADVFPSRSAIGISTASPTLPGKTMASFRYRTATLLGPWRESAEAAAQDAIRAKQARRDENGEGWHWVVPGIIEEGQGRPIAASGSPRATRAPHPREPQES